MGMGGIAGGGAHRMVCSGGGVARPICSAPYGPSAEAKSARLTSWRATAARTVRVCAHLPRAFMHPGLGACGACGASCSGGPGATPSTVRAAYSELRAERTDADEDGDVDEAPQPSLQRTARLRKNQDLLRSLRSQHGARLRLRAERGPSPQELVKQASLAARLQDLDIIRLEAGIERREPAQWDELRVWDPGDG